MEAPGQKCDRCQQDGHPRKGDNSCTRGIDPAQVPPTHIVSPPKHVPHVPRRRPAAFVKCEGVPQKHEEHARGQHDRREYDRPLSPLEAPHDGGGRHPGRTATSAFLVVDEGFRRSQGRGAHPLFIVSFSSTLEEPIRARPELFEPSSNLDESWERGMPPPEGGGIPCIRCRPIGTNDCS
jgi:hypothetical protein